MVLGTWPCYTTRSKKIQALEKISLWGIDWNTFKMAIEEISGKDYEINRTFINDIKFFSKKFLGRREPKKK